MKVVILCGGMGTRLREHTETKPKPMVEVGGRPMLWHIMKIFAHYGLNDFILCLGYKGDVIKQYFLNYEASTNDFTVSLGAPSSIQYHSADDREKCNWTVTLAATGENAMTGARLARVAKYLDGTETFALTYGDGVASVDLHAVLRFHKAHGKLATITGVRPPSRFGQLEIQGEQVKAFSEKPQIGSGLINGGFFFFEREFLDYVDEDSSCVLERTPLERCAADGQLMVFEHGGYWQCMDTFRDWQDLDSRWRNGEAPWVVWA